MGKKNTLRPFGLKDLERIISVAVVTGEGAVMCFQKAGVGGLYQGSIESPVRFRIKIMDFLHEDVMENVIEGIRRKYAVSAPLIDVLVLRDDDERLLEGLISKGRRAGETFFLNKEGEVRYVRPEKQSILNCRDTEEDIPDDCPDKEKELIYHDVTDILYSVKGKDGVFIHEIKGEPGQYLLDFDQMKYWKLGGLEPDENEKLPAYSSYRDISFGAKAFLLINQEARADVLLNCSMRWCDYKLILEVSRPFPVEYGKTTVMYNYFTPFGRYLSSFWFNGVDTKGKSKLMDNRAYVKTLRGRQWYHISYSGKVEKERFEPDGF